jgi:sialic acid synthase SpsE
MKLIAEIGLNHAYAPVLIQKAAQAGFDFIKFQYWDVADFETPDCPNSLKRWQMSYRDLERYCAMAREYQLGVIVSPTISTLKTAASFGRIKISSDMAKNTDFLEAISEIGCRDVILSTGGCDMADIDQAIAMLGRKLTTILHCVSKYPHSMRDADIYRIDRLRRRYGTFFIGYSDHTVRQYGSHAAAALGIDMLEVHVGVHGHFTPDTPVSLDIRHMQDFAESIGISGGRK